MTVVLLVVLAGVGYLLYLLEQQVKRIADVVGSVPLEARHHAPVVQQPPVRESFPVQPQPAPWDQASYWKGPVS
jgi:hypothetical protein